jgi:hypothetical protein
MGKNDIFCGKCGSLVRNSMLDETITPNIHYISETVFGITADNHYRPLGFPERMIFLCEGCFLEFDGWMKNDRNYR